MTSTQAIGYAIMAAEDLKLDKETIKKLVNAMENNIEDWTEEFADSTYDKIED